MTHRPPSIIVGATLITKQDKYWPWGKSMLGWIKKIYNRVMLEIRYRRKLRELRKRDPFIYK